MQQTHWKNSPVNIIYQTCHNNVCYYCSSSTDKKMLLFISNNIKQLVNYRSQRRKKSWTTRWLCTVNNRTLMLSDPTCSSLSSRYVRFLYTNVDPTCSSLNSRYVRFLYTNVDPTCSSLSSRYVRFLYTSGCHSMSAWKVNENGWSSILFLFSCSTFSHWTCLLTQFFTPLLQCVKLTSGTF